MPDTKQTRTQLKGEGPFYLYVMGSGHDIAKGLILQSIGKDVRLYGLIYSQYIIA